MQGGFYQTVSEYSRRALTDNKDKLPAFSGLAQRFHQSFGGDSAEYLAGLWSTDFPRSLLWSLHHSVPSRSIPSYSLIVRHHGRGPRGTERSTPLPIYLRYSCSFSAGMSALSVTATPMARYTPGAAQPCLPLLSTVQPCFSSEEARLRIPTTICRIEPARSTLTCSRNQKSHGRENLDPYHSQLLMMAGYNPCPAMEEGQKKVT